MRYSKMLMDKADITPSPGESPGSWLPVKAGLVTNPDGGFYTISPMGFRVVSKIEAIIRRNLDSVGVLEMSFPTVHPYELYNRSGRVAKYGKNMLRASDSYDHKYYLAPSHEEVALEFVRSQLQEGGNLPIIVYQISSKFRDHRPLMGLIRSIEFRMVDTYSFDEDKVGMRASHELISGAYHRIVSDVGINCKIVHAGRNGIDDGVATIFTIASKFGKGKIYSCSACGQNMKQGGGLNGPSPSCPSCGHAMSKATMWAIGEVADQGTVYSKPLQVTSKNRQVIKKFIHATANGLSIPRLMAAVIEQNHDDLGMIWPESVAPFKYVIIPINSNASDTTATDGSLRIYELLRAEGKDVIVDDRAVKPRRKFKDANLIGFPYQIVITPETLGRGEVQIQSRKDREKVFISVDSLNDIDFMVTKLTR